MAQPIYRPECSHYEIQIKDDHGAWCIAVEQWGHKDGSIEERALMFECPKAALKKFKKFVKEYNDKLRIVVVNPKLFKAGETPTLEDLINANKQS